MDSKELRQKFLKFFESKGHKILPASSSIPENDPSVLFTTAGMQQFKRYYLAPDEAPAETVATCQPCVRTSDIEEVGDATHLTFFEMLGNFSFNDYFKKEAIGLAFEFLTKDLGIEPERIWCSVFAGDEKNSRDSGSAEILEKMGIKYKELSREDTFWGPTGNEGPCGPAVEVYVDEVEIWTLVFNEYVFKNDQYEKSEFRGVDTGMGLERMLAVFNGKTDVYQTDLFEPIIKKIEELSNKKYDDNHKAFRIIADHIKAAVFLLNQNILPSNKDQGYITRRLIRRAMVKLNSLSVTENVLGNLAGKVFEIYEDIYKFNRDNILAEIQKEENKFRSTLDAGFKILKSKTKISGKDLFDLYQSYGLPMEIVVEESKNLNIEINNQTIEQFNNLLKAHQDLSRTASAGMFKGGLTTQSEQTTKYHTATHLLLAALRQVLGGDIHQRGSNITDERLRFDFSYPEKLTDEQIKKVEDLVNEKISEDLPVTMEEMSLEDAKNCGIIGEFGEKYQEKVKVYIIGDSSTSSEPPFSREICGGPHMERTGILGHFKIIKEESSSAGIRRIKAVLE